MSKVTKDKVLELWPLWTGKIFVILGRNLPYYKSKGIQDFRMPSFRYGHFFTFSKLSPREEITKQFRFTKSQKPIMNVT
jgi:hypothetical protein